MKGKVDDSQICLWQVSDANHNDFAKLICIDGLIIDSSVHIFFSKRPLITLSINIVCSLLLYFFFNNFVSKFL